VYTVIFPGEDLTFFDAPGGEGALGAESPRISIVFYSPAPKARDGHRFIERTKCFVNDCVDQKTNDFQSLNDLEKKDSFFYWTNELF